MPLYKVTQTRSFQEWYIAEAECLEDATVPGAFLELAHGSDLGVDSVLEAEDVEEVTESELNIALGGAK